MSATNPPAGAPGSATAPDTARSTATPRVGLFAYLMLGALFGIVLVKAEVVSWYRIQEMFRFQAFHMYGVIGSAVATSALLLAIIRRRGVRTLDGEPVVVPPKTLGRGTRYWAGGTVFGLGWALTGACPGPLAALVGAGIDVLVVTIASAVVGTWCYGALRPRLPH